MDAEYSLKKWEVKSFETARKEKPVEEFIYSQSSQAIAKITRNINLLEKYGPYLEMPHSRKLSGQLYELRIRGKQEIRILYSFVGKTAYLLHGFKKQTQQIPQKEIGIAQNRLNLV